AESLPLRKELAGALEAVGRHREALMFYRGIPSEPEDCYQLALLHAGARNFMAALKQCDALLAKSPGDRKARRLLADVLSWDKKYRESLNLLDELLQEEPDSDELKTRRAEDTLWSGERENALALFQALL